MPSRMPCKAERTYRGQYDHPITPAINAPHPRLGVESERDRDRRQQRQCYPGGDQLPLPRQIDGKELSHACGSVQKRASDQEREADPTTDAKHCVDAPYMFPRQWTATDRQQGMPSRSDPIWESGHCNVPSQRVAMGADMAFMNTE